MATASFAFLGFALLAALIYNAHPSLFWRAAILLITNLCFLATFSHNPAAFIPLAVFLAAGFFGLRLMQRPHTRATCWIVVATIVTAFIWLKKYTLLPEETFLRFAYTTLGLSYIFFRVLHMIIDAHQQELSDPVTPLSYLNYTLNFTTLISGPIERYPDFIEQHLAPVRPPVTLAIMGRGAERIVTGFFKVNVMGLILWMAQAHAIDALSASQPLFGRAITGAVIAAAYPVYLYFNFSGYCDIVIGVAAFFRIVLPENFDRPFSTDNFLDFWNHWHMTLSRWLKTYVYNPLLLSLMRRFPSPRAVPTLGVTAFFVTFFLIGVWHGRTSEFLFYGLLLGAGVSINKLYQLQMAKRLGKKRFKALEAHWLYLAVCRGLNFTFFAFFLLWFWSNWSDLGRMAHKLRAPAQMLGWLLIFAGSAAILTAWQFVRKAAADITFDGDTFFLSRYFRTVWDTGLAFILIAIMTLLSTPAPDIVYKTF
jgi:D-alanyl-lipoteichoic acid acyltransferase DltB (MBOAT superfamily)